MKQKMTNLTGRRLQVLMNTGMKRMLDRALKTSLIVLLLCLATEAGFAEPASGGDPLREALWQHHVMKDVAQAIPAYEAAVRAALTDEKAGDESLRAILGQYRSALVETGQGEAFADRARGLGVSDDRLKGLAAPSDRMATADVEPPATGPEVHLLNLNLKCLLDVESFDVSTRMADGEPLPLAQTCGERGWRGEARLTRRGELYTLSLRMKHVDALETDSAGTLETELRFAQTSGGVLRDGKGRDRFRYYASVKTVRLKPTTRELDYKARFKLNYQAKGKDEQELWEPDLCLPGGRTDEIFTGSAGDRCAIVASARPEGRSTRWSLRLGLPGLDREERLEICGSRNARIVIPTPGGVYRLRFESEVGESDRAVPAGSDRTDEISLDFREVEAGAILRLIATRFGLDAASPAEIGSRKVTLRLTGVTADQGLQALAQAAGARLVRDGRRVLLEGDGAADLKRRRTLLLEGWTAERLRSELPGGTGEAGLQLLRAEPEGTALRVELLATDAAFEALKRRADVDVRKSVLLEFEIYELDGSAETLLSRPRILTRTGDPGTVTVGSDKGANFELKVVADDAGGGQWRVSLDLRFEEPVGGAVRTVRARNDFRCAGEYVTRLADATGTPRYKVKLTLVAKDPVAGPR